MSQFPVYRGGELVAIVKCCAVGNGVVVDTLPVVKIQKRVKHLLAVRGGLALVNCGGEPSDQTGVIRDQSESVC